MEVYDEIQEEIWSSKQAKDCQSLSPYQIAEAFGQEALEIIPRVNRTLKRRLLPLREAMIDLQDKSREKQIDDFTCKFYQQVLLKFNPLYQTMCLFENNNLILKFAQRKKTVNETPQTKNPVNDQTIAKAKDAPILSMYSFEKLRLTGNKHMAVCPFHGDNGPSFFIYDNNTYHCFGCQANGTSIDFYMKLNNCDFKDAVKALAGV